MRLGRTDAMGMAKCIADLRMTISTTVCRVGDDLTVGDC